MESLDKADIKRTSPQVVCQKNYDLELASILNNDDAFQVNGHTSSYYANAAKEDPSFCFKLDSKPSCDFAHVDPHISLTSIPTGSFHCDNVLDAPESVLLSTGNTFHDGTLDYSLPCPDFNVPTFEGIETQKLDSKSVNIPSVEPCSVVNEQQAHENATNSTEICVQTDCFNAFHKHTDASTDNNDKDNKDEVAVGVLQLEKPEIKTCVPSVSPCIKHDKTDIKQELPNMKEESKSEENLKTTKIDNIQSKSEEEFNNTSPLSTEDLSLDSGVASLDDNEQNCKVSPSEENTNNNAVLKKERKRLRSSLSKPEKSTSVKRKRSCTEKLVSFDGVTVFYFSRRQSFVTVPSQGGSTLGMSLSHNHMKKMSLKQHRKSVVQRRRSMEREQNRQQRISMKLKQLKQVYPNLETGQLMPMVIQSEPEEESSDSSSASEDIDDDENADDNYFLQPISTKKRRLLLRMSGVQKIDSEEKLSNKLTRESREICGCDCNGICLPSTCLCALSGIPCQVDRESFPCGCTAQGCSNNNGRVEFDAERVRTHYSHTMRRLRLEETGIASNQDPQVDAVLELKQSPYVSAGNGERNEGTSIQAAQPSNVCSTGISTTQQQQQQQLGEDQACCSTLPNFNQSNNGHLLFTQNPAKSWYMPNACKSMYQNSDIWSGTDTPQQSRQYDSSNITYHPEQSTMEGTQFIEPQPVTQTLPASNTNYLNDCIYSIAENEMCTGFPVQYGATQAKASPLETAVNEASSFRLDPIASFFPQVDTAEKVPSRATVYESNFTATDSVASTLANCQSFSGITYRTEMDSISGGINFQTCDSDTLSIATSTSDHGQDAVDIVA